MPEQQERSESDVEPTEEEPRYNDYPARVLAATRAAGESHGLDQATNPMYAHLLNLAYRLDYPWLLDKDVSSLSNEFRQICKHLKLDMASSEKKADASILSSIGGKITRPTRPA